jgi:hypothetical protein
VMAAIMVGLSTLVVCRQVVGRARLLLLPRSLSSKCPLWPPMKSLNRRLRSAVGHDALDQVFLMQSPCKAEGKSVYFRKDHGKFHLDKRVWPHTSPRAIQGLKPVARNLRYNLVEFTQSIPDGPHCHRGNPLAYPS